MGDDADSIQPPKGAPTTGPPSVIPLLPLLIALIIPSLILPPFFLFLLSKTVRPVLMATAAAIPFSLFICGWWAIGASFESIGDVDQQDRWWATTGMRLGAVLCWIMAALFARLVWLRRRKLERTVSVVEVGPSSFQSAANVSSRLTFSYATRQCSSSPLSCSQSSQLPPYPS